MSAVRTVVIGGGVAGLAAALRCQQGGDDVTVLEASSSVGGKLASHVVDGLTLDAGAESVLARRPEALALMDAAGRRDDVVHPATTGAGIWLETVLRLPRSQLLGVPSDAADADLRALLGDDGTQRVASEPPWVGALPADISVAELVESPAW